jgi:hypothetical protein
MTHWPPFRCILRNYNLVALVRGGIGRTNEQLKMPKPMKVKVFMDSSASTIEAQINSWLDQLGSATIIKTETVLTNVAEKPNDGTHPCIVITVWYEPRDSN